MLTRPAILCITFALTTTAVVALGTSCAQPVPFCSSAHGYYAAEFTLTSGDANSACGQLVGDVLGMTTYFQEGGPNGTPDYEQAKVAIRTETIGSMIDYAEFREAIPPDDEQFYGANAIGSFTAAFPDDATFCMVDDFDDAHVVLPAIDEFPDDPMTPDEDESLPAQPAIDATFRWSNARFVVSADAQGTQFEADLEYTQDGCTAEYHVVGLYPAAGCETTEDCENELTINSSFPVRCNTDLGLCVLDGDLPAYE